VFSGYQNQGQTRTGYWGGSSCSYLLGWFSKNPETGSDMTTVQENIKHLRPI
jgi:hypothetical protein